MLQYTRQLCAGGKEHAPPVTTMSTIQFYELCYLIISLHYSISWPHQAISISSRSSSVLFYQIKYHYKVLLTNESTDMPSLLVKNLSILTMSNVSKCKMWNKLAEVLQIVHVCRDIGGNTTKHAVSTDACRLKQLDTCRLEKSAAKSQHHWRQPRCLHLR